MCGFMHAAQLNVLCYANLEPLPIACRAEVTLVTHACALAVHGFTWCAYRRLACRVCMYNVRVRVCCCLVSCHLCHNVLLPNSSRLSQVYMQHDVFD